MNVVRPRRAPDLDIARTARDLADALSRPPYHQIVRGFGAQDDPHGLKALAAAVAALPGPDGRCATDMKISFTRVRVNPQSARRTGASTRLSRTSEAMPAHTDGSYAARPPHLVAFHVVVADPHGGDSRVVGVDEVLAALDDETKARLAEPVYPFGRRLRPVLFADPRAPSIRYYRHQIETGLDEGLRLAPPFLDAIEALDRAVEDPVLGTRFRLEDGDVVFINNRKALHARTAFSDDSPRLMHRIRARAPALG